MHKKVFPARPSHLVTLGLSAALLTPTLLAGCGGQSAQTTTSLPQAPPPSSMSGGRMSQTGTRQGMTTKQKVVLVAGAALLYYLYKKHQNAQAATGANGKYYISESTGRVYYRILSGADKGKFQWVSPPAQAMQVPQAAAQQYGLQGYQGYNNGASGQPFGGYGATSQGSYTDTVPATDLS